MLPNSTKLAKFNAFIAIAAFIIFIVAFSSNYWLEQRFHFPVNSVGIASIPVDANIGLFTACKVEYYPNNGTSESCSPDGAAEWQFISAGLSIAGLVLGLLGVVLAVLSVVLQRAANSLRVKLFIVMCYFMTCAVCVGPLIMFPLNRKIQVRPNQSTFQADFNIGWAYTVSVVSTGLYAGLVVLNIVDIIWTSDQDDKEYREALSKDVIES